MRGWILALGCFCAFACTSLHATLKQLQRTDVRPMMSELLNFHVEFKELSPLLVKRSFKIAIEQFDSERLYLLADEAMPFLDLNSDQIAKVIEEYGSDQFSQYEALVAAERKAILRARAWRHSIEQVLIKESDLPVQSKEDRSDYSFATSEEQLKKRIVSQLIAFLQSESRDGNAPLSSQAKEKLFALLEKRLQRFETTYLVKEEHGKLLFDKSSEHFFALHLLKAFAKSLDAHTAFFSAEEAMEMRTSLEKEFEGIGVILREGVDGVTIAGVVRGGPADKSGKIAKGDFLTHINGFSVQGFSYEEVLDKMKGDGSKNIRLGLRRLEKEGKLTAVEVELVREKIMIEEDRVAYSSEPFANGIIGKITLPSFYESGSLSSCESDMREAIKALKKKGKLLGLVIDMRENSGGFLNQAVKVAGLFITNGVVVVSKYSQGEIQYMRNVDGRSYFNGPIVILTSKASASAAEIVAQALQDYGSALVVGDERTYGKGTIQYQTVTDDGAKAFFKVTVGKYYTVSGRSTQIEGVKADIVVPTHYHAFNIGERFLEYPLSHDQIASVYADPLTDIDEQNRRWFQKHYLPNLQKKQSIWAAMLPSLRANSAFRQDHDPNFKLFTKRLSQTKNDFPTPASFKENWGVQDLQMTEVVQILKDMIFKDPSL